MTDEEIYDIAAACAKSFGSLDGCELQPCDKEEFFDCYFFDLVWVDAAGNIPEKPPVAGGPRGVAVSKHTFEASAVSYPGYAELVQKQREREWLLKRLKSSGKKRAN